MPHGIECDQYSVMGEIISFVNFKNILTGEKLVADDHRVQ